MNEVQARPSEKWSIKAMDLLMVLSDYFGRETFLNLSVKSIKKSIENGDIEGGNANANIESLSYSEEGNDIEHQQLYYLWPDWVDAVEEDMVVV